MVSHRTIVSHLHTKELVAESARLLSSLHLNETVSDDRSENCWQIIRGNVPFSLFTVNLKARIIVRVNKGKRIEKEEMEAEVWRCVKKMF